MSGRLSRTSFVRRSNYRRHQSALVPALAMLSELAFPARTSGPSPLDLPSLSHLQRRARPGSFRGIFLSCDLRKPCLSAIFGTDVPLACAAFEDAATSRVPFRASSWCFLSSSLRFCCYSTGGRRCYTLFLPAKRHELESSSLHTRASTDSRPVRLLAIDAAAACNSFRNMSSSLALTYACLGFGTAADNPCLASSIVARCGGHAIGFGTCAAMALHMNC